MGLKVKKFQEILRGMVEWVSANTDKLTDFSEGSVIRTLLEAVSSSVEQAYYNM